MVWEEWKRGGCAICHCCSRMFSLLLEGGGLHSGGMHKSTQDGPSGFGACIHGRAPTTGFHVHLWGRHLHEGWDVEGREVWTEGGDRED
jgi:hypothetical protein